MELALAVLCWTLAVSMTLVTIMIVGYIAAITELAKVRAHSESRLH